MSSQVLCAGGIDALAATRPEPKLGRVMDCGVGSGKAGESRRKGNNGRRRWRAKAMPLPRIACALSKRCVKLNPGWIRESSGAQIQDSE